MDGTHIHLLINHFPILGALFGMAIMGAGVLFKKPVLINTSLIMLVILGLLSIPLLPTGEAAEEAIEHLPGVDKQYIETHEDLGKTAVFVMLGLGVLSLVTLVVRFRKIAVARALTIVTLVATIGVFALMVKVGDTGGEIRHPEVRSTATIQPNTENPATEQEAASKQEEDEDDDDD